MDVVLLGAGRPAKGIKPSALKKFGMQANALDWQIQSFSALDDEVSIHYLGGYHVSEVVERYPHLNFTVVPDWHQNGPLHTLLHAPFSSDAMLVSYSDTIFRESELKKFADSSGDVVVGVDSHWRFRFENRSKSDIDIAETLNVSEYFVNRPGVEEFTGLIKFSPKVVAYLSKLKESSVGTDLLHLIVHLKGLGFSVDLHDFCGEWAEFNAPEDVAYFVLGTKAETLARLQPLVRHSHIGIQESFTTVQWEAHPEIVLDKLQSRFDGVPLVVRSSAKNEDGWGSSNAGGFESRLDVDSTDRSAIEEAISSVVQSYGDKSTDADQVLVQPFVSQVRCAGVVFTCSLETGAPYYRFNFDDESNSTDSVTSGEGGPLRTVILNRRSPEAIMEVEPSLSGVLQATQELERLLGFSKLDIEFALDYEGVVHVFQVRPITVDHADYETGDGAVAQTLEQCKAYFTSFEKANPFTVGRGALFGNMSDWNPAEIIGTRPKPLAFSLYRQLITDEVWAKQRSEFGYRDVRPYPLLVSYGGHPYVDLRASFNSFIPAQLDHDLADKLASAYIDILTKNPELHDKIEFDVAFTIWTPNFAALARQRLIKYAFSEAEIDDLGEALKIITRSALERLEDDTASILTLTERRNLVVHTPMRAIEKIHILLDDCRRHGTLAFSHAARAGFVATTLLKSFVAIGFFSTDREQQFMNSIHTVAKEFELKKHESRKSQWQRQALIEAFGHLRPGTYEITAQAYWEDAEKYLFGSIEQPAAATVFELTDVERSNVQSFLVELGSQLTPRQLFEYIRAAIEARERVKFEFTRNLSQALDACLVLADELAISREDMAFLEYPDLERFKINVFSDIELRHSIERNKVSYVATQLIELPSLISRSADFDCFERGESQPNYVTNGRVESDLVVLEDYKQADLYGKIVLIPRADPGYDWLFGSGIAGLITMYGGANSHMAIRAAEAGLPAVIGVGEKRYEEIARLQRLQIDCVNQLVRTIQ